MNLLLMESNILLNVIHYNEYNAVRVFLFCLNLANVYKSAASPSASFVKTLILSAQ